MKLENKLKSTNKMFLLHNVSASEILGPIDEMTLLSKMTS